MSAQIEAIREGADWHGPGSPARRRRVFRWSALLWSLVFPPRGQHTAPTLSGLVLVGLALGLGIAAYNSASNILFITLSLLLACLILSGVLSWFNFMGTCWRLNGAPSLRAGEETTIMLEVRNGKRWLPTYGLWFELQARPALPPGAPESTVTGRDIDFKAAWRRAGEADSRVTLPLRERLEPGGEAHLAWAFRPARRGRERLEVLRVGSLVPFGFLKKGLGGGLRRDVVVWPAAIAYQAWPAGGTTQSWQGAHKARTGGGTDLLALRKYQTGDSHRLIHWKASARLRQLMVRQFAAEAEAGFFLQIETPAAVWRHSEQFELLCSLVATLAEDLFTAGRLAGASVNGGEFFAMRRVRDLEALLDRLATIEPVAMRGAGPGVPPVMGQFAFGVGGALVAPRCEASSQPTNWSNHTTTVPPVVLQKAEMRPAPPAKNGRADVITFAPDGTRGVCAYVGGQKAAAA